MTAGHLVNVIADRGGIIKRTVVSVENDVYFVCKPEEFEVARKEGREPVCTGFKREYILKEGRPQAR
jgi:hypothetical protein